MSNLNKEKIKKVITLVKKTENTDKEFLKVYRPQLKEMSEEELDLEIRLLEKEIAEMKVQV